jgi:hypothetical protein
VRTPQDVKPRLFCRIGHFANLLNSRHNPPFDDIVRAVNLHAAPFIELFQSIRKKKIIPSTAAVIMSFSASCS